MSFSAMPISRVPFCGCSCARWSHACARTAQVRALLLARIHEVFPLVCPMGGGAMRIITFLTDPAAVRAILAHLGEPTAPPRIAPARGPPLWDLPDAGTGDFDPHAQPAPEYELDLQCGRVEEFYDADIEKRQIKIARERGFEISEHALYLYADCTKPRCPHKK